MDWRATYYEYAPGERGDERCIELYGKNGRESVLTGADIQRFLSEIRPHRYDTPGWDKVINAWINKEDV